MKNTIKIKDKSIIVESDELSPFEITDIESKIEEDFNKLENKNIINHITQLYTLVAKYAVESYLSSKKAKMEKEKLSSKIDEVIEKTKILSSKSLF
ncbi:MAG: hypothetical protein AB1602_02800 [Elusimicrobiota bacterium]